MSLFKSISTKLKNPTPGWFKRLKRSYLLWGLCGFIIAFVLGFALFFPLDPVARQVEQLASERGNLTLNISNPGWALPLGISAEQLNISAPALQGETIQLGQLRVTPFWGSLLSADPGINISGELFSGELEATARKQGELVLKLRGASLAGQKLSPQLSLLLSGSNGNLDFTGTLPLGGNNQSQAGLTLEQIEVSGMSALGSGKDTLSAGNLQVKIDIKGSNATIETLDLSGGDLDLNGSGSLRLGSRPQLSRLNLSLVLKPGSGLDPQLRDLLGLLAKPEADGSIKFRLLGSLAAPQLR
ncbi:MAG TPA: type II secretion system protein GspN [Geothermobacteraceae bacterium]|nr:type II secretion system protein GspN [Geothermobacteraceae bacterium]